MPAGGNVPVAPDAPECCEGLAPIACGAPGPEGVCEPCVGASVCAACGDGVCGAGENICNCAQDCGGRDASCDDGSLPICDLVPPVCAPHEILAHQRDCYRCVNPATCRPWGEPGCQTDADCGPSDRCDDCAMGSCPACEDCVAACVPHGCATEPEPACDEARPACALGEVSVVQDGCWVCIAQNQCRR